MNLRLALAAALLGSAALASPASAHRLWILPSTTNVSGTDDWITFDAAASNDLFFPDHQPLRVPPNVTQPDGTMGAVEHYNVGEYRATFDLHLTQKGTYRLAYVSNGISGSYMLNGAEQRLPRGTRLADLATAIPANATDRKLSESLSRAEVFVTSGAPSTIALKPSGEGLEFVSVTHPDDLVTGETATFGFMADGKPAAAITVTVILGGGRYREAVGERTFTTDAKGQVAIDWPQAGMYWINATAISASTALPGTERRLAYSAVLEVLRP